MSALLIDSNAPRVLWDLSAIAQRRTRGKLVLGRIYVREHLPGWSALHAATMDSALTAHLKSRPVSSQSPIV